MLWVDMVVFMLLVGLPLILLGRLEYEWGRREDQFAELHNDRSMDEGG